MYFPLRPPIPIPLRSLHVDFFTLRNSYLAGEFPRDLRNDCTSVSDHRHVLWGRGNVETYYAAQQH